MVFQFHCLTVFGWISSIPDFLDCIALQSLKKETEGQDGWISGRLILLVVTFVWDFFFKNIQFFNLIHFKNLCRPCGKPSIKNIVRLLRDVSLQVWTFYLLLVDLKYLPFETSGFPLYTVNFLYLLFPLLPVTGTRVDEEVFFNF